MQYNQNRCDEYCYSWKNIFICIAWKTVCALFGVLLISHLLYLFSTGHTFIVFFLRMCLFFSSFILLQFDLSLSLCAPCLLKILEGRSYLLQHPWVGIVNRSQADINKNVDMIAARRREHEFFATSPDYGHLATQMGSEYLAKLLSKVSLLLFLLPL